ncbi:MAG TPA: hypothetical protein VEW05_30675 [Candidatus Polarisedimenticolia bacterium]|nr:hypothetical protein [Candidatus Polarisedimenticolia bacterium]
MPWALERYWKPICQEREGAGPKSGTLHLAQAQSNRGRRGRKKDFPDAERLVNRLVANELILSFVPDTEQRLWRTVPTKMTFAPTFGLLHHETIHGANDSQSYGRRIPWAGSVILRMSQQAKTHPHITRALKVVQPRF